jgi:hypothetical protein
VHSTKAPKTKGPADCKWFDQKLISPSADAFAFQGDPSPAFPIPNFVLGVVTMKISNQWATCASIQIAINKPFLRVRSSCGRAGVSFIAGLVALTAFCGTGYADFVTLQNATATFSQTIFGAQPVSQSIDGNFGNLNGWAVATSTGFNGAASQTAAYETAADLNANQITFTLDFLTSVQAPRHLLGRFRFSRTTDDRSLFADGLATGGDVTANWVVLTNPVVTGPAGMTFTTLGDNSVLVSGSVPNTGTYTVSYSTSLVDVTGFRLEALEDPSLPGGNGPGLNPTNGNFVLTELRVSSVPEPSSWALVSASCSLLFWRRRR